MPPNRQSARPTPRRESPTESHRNSITIGPYRLAERAPHPLRRRHRPHHKTRGHAPGRPADSKITIERLNKEIKRRADVVEIFPNPAPCLRLATAVVIEAHDEWQVTRRYVSDISMDELRVVIAAKERAATQHATPSESLTLELENA